MKFHLYVFLFCFVVVSPIKAAEQKIDILVPFLTENKEETTDRLSDFFLMFSTACDLILNRDEKHNLYEINDLAMYRTIQTSSQLFHEIKLLIESNDAQLNEECEYIVQRHFFLLELFKTTQQTTYSFKKKYKKLVLQMKDVFIKIAICLKEREFDVLISAVSKR